VRALEPDRLPPNVRLGTSSFSSPDWSGAFYPAQLPSRQFLEYYAQRYDTVEIDATWHALPTRRIFESWAARVPEGFTFALKAPKSITHERYLEGCEEEWRAFLDLTEALGPRRGPILLQFSYVSRRRDPREARAGENFRRRLERFLPLIPPEGRFAIEVRNRGWISEELLALLRSRGIGLVWADYYTMPRGPSLLAARDLVLCDFAYVRFLGNHRLMDARVAEARQSGDRASDWCSLLVDRTRETREWVITLQSLLPRVREMFVYFNNHYAGFAPGSLELFARLWKEEAPRLDRAPSLRA